MSFIDDDPKIIQIIPANGWYEITEEPAEPDCPIVVPIMFWALRDNGEMECHTARYGLGILDVPGDYIYDPLGEKVMFDQWSAGKLELRLKLLG